jgi:response regulator RpfG family c-di-GMP phosphodiesterase
MAQHTILCVDDEVGVLKALNRLLRRAGFRVVVAESGERGLEILKKEQVNLIISDQMMPGMLGTEFLQLSREIRPDAVRIMLTAHADVEAAIAAISIYKFILKPWNDAELLETIKGALKEQALTLKNRRLTIRIAQQAKKLQQGVKSLQNEAQNKNRLIAGLMGSGAASHSENSIDTMVRLLVIRMPEVAIHSTRVAAECVQVAQKICKEQWEIERIEIAAALHDIGKVGIPETILRKAFDALTPQELELMQSHPDLGYMALQSLPDLADVRVMVRSHHENYDGSGYPDGLRAAQIPLASRIIAVVNAYDNMCYSQTFGKMYTPEEARDRLRAGSGTLYSPEIVACYIEALNLEPEQHQMTSYELGGKLFYFPPPGTRYVTSVKTVLTAVEKVQREALKPWRIITMNQLEHGMVLSQDLYTAQTNRLLLSEDTVIDERHLERLREAKGPNRPGPIHIFKEKATV